MEQELDANVAKMLDGNVVAGIFMELFGVEMTAAPTECAHCGTGNALGALRVFNQAPGTVMRCPTCEQVMLRVVQTPDAIYLDARGAMYLRIAR